jgi:hypothetical protein
LAIHLENKLWHESGGEGKTPKFISTPGVSNDFLHFFQLPLFCNAKIEFNPHGVTSL